VEECCVSQWTCLLGSDVGCYGYEGVWVSGGFEYK